MPAWPENKWDSLLCESLAVSQSSFMMPEGMLSISESRALTERTRLSSDASARHVRIYEYCLPLKGLPARSPREIAAHGKNEMQGKVAVRFGTAISGDAGEMVVAVCKEPRHRLILMCSLPKESIPDSIQVVSAAVNTTTWLVGGPQTVRFRGCKPGGSGPWGLCFCQDFLREQHEISGHLLRAVSKFPARPVFQHIAES